jgi:hypothetical protein
MPEKGQMEICDYIYFIFGSLNHVVSSSDYIQNVPGGKVNILGGHSIGHSKQKNTICMYMCPITNGFRNRAISLSRRATRHVFTRAAKCIDTDGIFENILY